MKPLAASLGIVGAAISALGYTSLLPYAFVAWGLSSILWMQWAVDDRQYSLMTMNMIFLGVDLLGFIRWMAHG